jgi:histone-lysine N-methyltransferase SETMAR
MLTKGDVLLHDNARPHTAARTDALIKIFNWEIFGHPSYSSDLAPSDDHLFTKMKVWLATQRLQTNEELIDGVNNWLHNLAAPFFDEGLQKLVSRYDKCLNVDGNYVEKYCSYVCNCSI